MKSIPSLPSKPKGLLKFFFKLPKYLFKWHFGWIFGHRFLMITHVGRKSGKQYQTVLEIVRYNPSIQEYIVISGYGDKSDWYQNIVKSPAIDIQVGENHFVPQQKILSADETFQVLDEYRKNHSQAFQELLTVMRYPYDGTTESLHMLSGILRSISFRPQ
jgi:deazaflavin-dependent oxidoreductase (nitroreductase family)